MKRGKEDGGKGLADFKRNLTQESSFLNSTQK